MKKTKIVHIRFDESQYEIIKKEADKLRLPISLLVRNITLEKLEKDNGKRN